MFGIEDMLGKKDDSVQLLLMKLRIAHMNSTAVLRGAAKYAPEQSMEQVNDIIATLDHFEKLIDELEATFKAIGPKVEALLASVTKVIDEEGGRHAH
jgi:hypothetical protein